MLTSIQVPCIFNSILRAFRRNRIKDRTKLHFQYVWAHQSDHHRWTNNTIWNYASGKLIFHTITNTFHRFDCYRPPQKFFFHIFVFYCVVSEKITKIMMIESEREREKTYTKTIRRFAIMFRSNLVMFGIDFESNSMG